MKAYELQGPGGVDAMALVEKAVPVPGAGQVLVKLKAATINYRDLLTVKGGYGSRQKFPLIPLSDGATVATRSQVQSPAINGERALLGIQTQSARRPLTLAW